MWNYIRGHLDRGADDGLHPSDAADSQRLSTLICLETSQI